MSNTEETRGDALAALRAYQASAAARGRQGNGDEYLRHDLGDLLVDLAHLADTFDGEDETSGGYELERAQDVYAEELDE